MITKIMCAETGKCYLIMLLIVKIIRHWYKMNAVWIWDIGRMIMTGVRLKHSSEKPITMALCPHKYHIQWHGMKPEPLWFETNN